MEGRHVDVHVGRCRPALEVEHDQVPRFGQPPRERENVVAAVKAQVGGDPRAPPPAVAGSPERWAEKYRIPSAAAKHAR